MIENKLQLWDIIQQDSKQIQCWDNQVTIDWDKNGKLTNTKTKWDMVEE